MPSASAQPMRYGSLINPAEGSYINKPYDIRSVLRIVSLEQRVESDVEVFHLSLEDEQVCLCREACPRRMGWRVRRARVPRARARIHQQCGQCWRVWEMWAAVTQRGWWPGRAHPRWLCP